MKVSDFLAATAATVKGVVKIVVQSRRCRIGVGRSGRIVIMGNGPSLSANISGDADFLRNSTTMAVNFAANAPEFATLSPDCYILADPHFFRSADDENVARLWKSLSAVQWPMILFVPARERSRAIALLGAGSKVEVATFNPVGVEGFKVLCHLAYRMNLAMPRPRNVLIPAIMVAMAMGYGEIVILGADHSWMKTLSVNDDNEVVSVQTHFYKESGKEEERVRHEYRGIRLHQIVDSFAVAFRSYHLIRAYADSRGVRIINATPGSFIDAFQRARICDL